MANTEVIRADEFVPLASSSSSSSSLSSEAIQQPQQQQRHVRHRQQQREEQSIQDITVSFSQDEANIGRAVNTRGVYNEVNDKGKDENESRIIGGEDVPWGTYPFFVEWDRGCGGTLIHNDLVLSAAHCYNPRADKKTVWVGGVRAGQGRERTVVEARVHPLYNSVAETYDFVILRLDQEIRGAITPVRLNTRPSNFRQPSNGEQLKVIGLGVTDLNSGFRSEYLQETTVNYIANCAAKSAYEPGIVKEAIMFCAGAPQGGRDSCQGMHRCVLCAGFSLLFS
jgi:hypothetical protein